MTGETKEFSEVLAINVGYQDGANSSATNPSLSFGDGDTGFRESADDTLELTTAGLSRFFSSAGIWGASNGAGPAILNEAATSTNPTLIPNRADTDTGLGSSGTDRISIITGAIEAMRLQELSSHVMQTHEAQVGLTADVSSAQGGLPLLSSYNVISTSANAGDACTLPTAFNVGQKVTIKNDAAANAVDVFPAAGDDLGAGANTAASLAAGASITYLGTVASTTWTSIGN